MARGGRASVRLFALSSASGGSRNRTAPTPISASTVASTAKWMRGASPAPAASAASPAPTRPPAENAAWKVERIERPESRSSASPWAFAATLIAPKAAPKPNSAAARAGSPVASEVATREPAPSSRPGSVTRLLPMRSHRRPASGIATSAPKEAANSASPRRAFVSEA